VEDLETAAGGHGYGGHGGHHHHGHHGHHGNHGGHNGNHGHHGNHGGTISFGIGGAHIDIEVKDPHHHQHHHGHHHHHHHGHHGHHDTVEVIIPTVPVITTPMVQPTIVTPPVVYPSPGYSSPAYPPITQQMPSVGYPANPMTYPSPGMSFSVTTPVTVPNVGFRTLIPIQRYWSASVSDHFYSSSLNEHPHHYASEGVAFQLASAPGPGLVPVYRYFKADCHDHFYTTNSAEIGVAAPGAVGKHNYRCEGVLGYISPVQSPGTIPVYRYYKGATSDHFYTTNVSEIGVVVNGASGNHGYVCEGVLGYAFM